MAATGLTRRWILGLLLAMLCGPALLAGTKAQPKKKDEKAPVKAAFSDPIQAKSPKGEQDFWYYVPACYDAKAKKAKRLPLVLSYHGAGGTGQAEIGGWKALAEQYGFVVACPTSVLAGAGQQAGVPRRVVPEEFTQESETALSIVEFIKEKLPIDSRRVMVTGFSGGGNPTYWLGFTHPEVFPFFCPRCGNFPSVLPAMVQRQPEVKTAAETAATQSRLYIFWGEKDHPIILREIDQTLAWVNVLKPEHCKQEKIPGMGHDSRPGLAAAWFAEAMKEAEKSWEAAAKEKYPVLLEAAAAAIGKGETADAIRQYQEAIGMEEEYKLGRKAQDELKKIAEEGRKALEAARALAFKKDPTAEQALQDVAAKYKGTDPGDKAAELLEKQKK